MQVVPICIVACLLVVSLSGTSVYKRRYCMLSDPVTEGLTTNNVIEKCVCRKAPPYNYWDCKPKECKNLYDVLKYNKNTRCLCKLDNGNQVWMCELLVGCKSSGRYYHPGTMRKNCLCKKGPRPGLQKYSSRYHWSCTQCLYGPPTKYYPLNAKWTTKEDNESKTCTCGELLPGWPEAVCENTKCNKQLDTYPIKTALSTCRCTNGDGGLARWKCS